jgi:two-component system capsular synthesis response regulator RcsB
MTLRVVLADDHPIVLLGSRMLIEQGGLEIVGEARNSQELMLILAATPCDVLVTDFAMPHEGHLDGLAMLGVIRRKYPALPIVVLTNIANAGILRALLGEGVLGIVEKGAEMSELPAAVRAVVKGTTYISNKLQRELAAQGFTSEEGRQAPRLTARELEVVRLLASGKSPTEVGQMLHRTVKTVSWTKISAKRKLGLKSDAELYEYISNQGLNA